MRKNLSLLRKIRRFPFFLTVEPGIKKAKAPTLVGAFAVSRATKNYFTMLTRVVRERPSTFNFTKYIPLFKPDMSKVWL